MHIDGDPEQVTDGVELVKLSVIMREKLVTTAPVLFTTRKSPLLGTPPVSTWNHELIVLKSKGTPVPLFRYPVVPLVLQSVAPPQAFALSASPMMSPAKEGSAKHANAAIITVTVNPRTLLFFIAFLHTGLWTQTPQRARGFLITQWNSSAKCSLVKTDNFCDIAGACNHFPIWTVALLAARLRTWDSMQRSDRTNSSLRFWLSTPFFHETAKSFSSWELLLAT